jgi:hypothetical protein
MISMGVNPLHAVLARILPLGMHLGTTMYQSRQLNKIDKNKNMPQEDVLKEKRKTYINAVFAHGLYNSLLATSALLGS